MKLSVYISVICVSLLSMSFGVHAQTPTPHPNALEPGMYQFEDLSSPDIELGGTWSISNLWDTNFLRTTAVNSTLTFHVTEDSDYLLIHHLLQDVDVFSWEICVDMDCYSINDRGASNVFRITAIPLNNTNSQIVITKINHQRYASFDFMTINQGLVVASAISGTSSPTPTPEPYYIFGSISGTSGDVDTRFDMIITVGDVAVSSALLFLLFSLWAFIFLVVIPRRDNVGE